jgi:hypothetical protein
MFNVYVNGVTNVAPTAQGLTLPEAVLQGHQLLAGNKSSEIYDHTDAELATHLVATLTISDKGHLIIEVPTVNRELFVNALNGVYVVGGQ